MADLRGDNWIRWYTRLRESWVALRGAGAAGGVTGAQLPAMDVADALAVVSQLTGPLAQAIRTVSDDGRVWDVRNVTPDGHRLGGLGIGATSSAEVGAYLSSPHVVSSTKWYRRIDTGIPSGWQTFTPARANQIPLVSGLRESIAPWSDAIALVATLAVAGDSFGAWDLARKLTPTEINSLWGAIYRATIALSASADAPPVPTLELAKQAARYAVDKSKGKVQEISRDVATAAGELAGFVAETAGQVAGKFGSAFFGELGLAGLVAIGVVLYVVVA